MQENLMENAFFTTDKAELEGLSLMMLPQPVVMPAIGMRAIFCENTPPTSRKLN
jgi:hypothetical protein